MEAKKKQLLFAVILGGAAVVMTQLYLEGEVSRYKPKDLIEVAVAKTPLPAGSPLLTANISKKAVPKSWVPASAVLYQDVEAYVGQFLSVNVPPGDYLMQNYFELRRAVGSMLSEEISGDNARAVSIPVSQLNSLSGSIITGDVIDILYTFSVPNTAQQMTVLLLQNVPVISTGEYSAAEQELRGGMGSSSHYSTVTLLLSLNDAARLKFAEKSGTIDVLLRNRGDASRAELKPISHVEDILREEDKQALGETVKKLGFSEEDKAVINRRLQSLYDTQSITLPKGD